LLRFIDLHRMDVVCHHPGCARSTNGGDIEDGTILDRRDLRRKFVLVAVLLKITIKLNGLKELMSFRANLIDRNILAQPKCASTRFRSWVANAIFMGPPPFLSR